MLVTGCDADRIAADAPVGVGDVVEEAGDVVGIRPSGLCSFNLTPQLPASWPSMSLRRIHAFDSVFDISVEREGEKIKVTVSSGKKVISNELIMSGETIPVVFDDCMFRRSRTEEIIIDKQ